MKASLSLTLPVASSPHLPVSPATAGGENRLITVLFADMSGSVAATQALDPEEAAALVNRLLEVMVDATFRFGGQVDRFLGDGVLAVFGAPLAGAG